MLINLSEHQIFFVPKSQEWPDTRQMTVMYFDKKNVIRLTYRMPV